MNFYLSNATMQANNTLPEAIAHNIETRLNISSFYRKLCTLIPRHKLHKAFSKFSLEQFRHRSFEVFINKPEILNYYSSLEAYPLGSKKGNSHTRLPPLFSILAGIGLTFVWQDQRKRNRWSSTISRLYLLSPHCNAVIPLAEVLQKINCLNSTISLMLWFATEYHSESCPTRSAITAFLSEHLSQPIEEGATAFPKSMDDSLGSGQSWVCSRKVYEDLNSTFTRDLLKTHPEIFQAIIMRFSSLPKEYFKNVITEFSLQSESETHAQYIVTPLPRNTALNHILQIPPDLSGPHPMQIPISDARRHIREVHYDRGTIVNALDIDTKEMAGFPERYESFNKSEYLRGKTGAYQLSQRGFFFAGDRKAVGKLRCSFCRRTIRMFTKYDAPHLEKEFDRHLIALLNRHSHQSPTCPFSLGLDGDNKHRRWRRDERRRRYSVDDIARVVAPFITRRSNQLSRVDLNEVPHTDSSALHFTASSILSQSPVGLPPLDGELASTYNNSVAESEFENNSNFEYESRFESECEKSSEASVLEDLTPESSPIDYLLGASPKHPEYRTLQTRIDTFDVVNWRLQSISRENSAFLKPEWFARAGFFYTGTADSVSCFCCGLGLGHWEATDDPFVEHAKFYPRCAWLLIRNGRHKVKLSYMKWNIDSIKPADYDLIRDVHDVSGGLDPEHLCPIDYRTEMREAKARVDLPAHRAIVDELGFSADLMLHALASQLKETGDDHRSAQHLFESLWAYVEWKDEKQIDSDAEFVARAEELRRHTFCISSSNASDTGPPARSQASAGGAEDSLCVVCTRASRAVVLMPCGHLAVCQSCYGRLQQCPVCRTVIRGAVRSYL